MEDLETYACLIGKIIVNLHSLEFILRCYLSNRNDPPNATLAPGALQKLKVGDVVPLGEMTNFDTLGELIDRYNQYIPDLAFAVDRSVIDLRDALAHGRASAFDRPEITLMKFAKPARGAQETSVVYAEVLNETWLNTQRKRVRDELLKVFEANKRLRPPGTVLEQPPW